MDKTVHINKELHNKLKDYCKQKGFKLNKLIEIIIEKYLKKEFKNDIG